LTGLTSPDYFATDSDAKIYGKSILSEMESIRYALGVCPQHDVLFDTLSVEETILFFSQLKGFSFEEALAESDHLTRLFHLGQRRDHLGRELSGGQRRKVSVAIAICGGSKFIVLDEPTAGMDPLARRELWDLLSTLRKGRTMLLTTHYMDEADVLGDRIGIMALGQMQCLGSSQFLKTSYGTGYKLIFDKHESMGADGLARLTEYVQKFIPNAKYTTEEGSDHLAMYMLPFDSIPSFGAFFSSLNPIKLTQLQVSEYNLAIVSLEDVFLKVGADHTVTPGSENIVGIGNRSYTPTLLSQVIGITYRRLNYAYNDFTTIPLLGLPMAAVIVSAILFKYKVVTKVVFINDLVAVGISMAGYIGVPGLIAEFIVRERSDRLRNVLTVMGCSNIAYWMGSFIADFILLLLPSAVMWISWGGADMGHFYSNKAGLCFFLSLLFNWQLISFSYFFSFVFTSPKACISFMPMLVILLLILPNVILLIVIQIANVAGTSLTTGVTAGVLLWGTMILSPHGAFFTSFLDVVDNFSFLIKQFPKVGATIAFMVVESALFLAFVYHSDGQNTAIISPQMDESFDPAELESLEPDVIAERQRAAAEGTGAPIFVNALRKVFPPKQQGRRAVTAVQNLTFGVQKGEIFGLLGANGAGKTTALSMLTRHLMPTSGDAFVSTHSILSDFNKGATHLGVVTQNNSLWDRLSVEDHLSLFARLRGVPEDLVRSIVDGTIDQLELTPHRKKLSMNLSGGMKRKLCVAIALIGDPDVVLLDEPSAGLDPVSRHNLWHVILKTMAHRSVILTTHSMDEAEALCKRIGIMVQGQLRVIGSKQYLKSKFGSGFELTAKVTVSPTDFEKQKIRLNSFVNGMFPSANIITENGGLITYHISREEMDMGRLFSELEQKKRELEVEDYTVAHPTLEQVFIRTVNKYTPPEPELKSSQGPVAGDQVVVELNKCGCSDFFVKVMIAISVVLLIVFWLVGIFALGRNRFAGILYLLGFIALIVSCVGCNLLCCACCRPPKGASE
jgi:ATP-binding cassette subfamily A (ABC1) protein 3